MLLAVWIFALLMLVFHWWLGDYEFRTKAIVTVIYLATWLLLFVGEWTMTGIQGLFGVILGIMTFGTEWSKWR